MKFFIAALLCCLAIAGVSSGALASTAAQEKQFVDTYRKAYEAKDDKTLVSLLYTKGADPAALGFYKMMMAAEAGGKISSIQLVDLNADDMARIETMKSPAGQPMKLVLPAAKKLVIKSEMKDKNGSSSSSSEIFVGESDGRLYVLVPAAAK